MEAVKTTRELAGGGRRVIELIPYARPQRRESNLGLWFALARITERRYPVDGGERVSTREVGVSITTHGSVGEFEEPFKALVAEMLPRIAAQL